MKPQYLLSEDLITLDTGDAIRTYGISAVDSYDSKHILSSNADVSPDKSFVIRIVNLLNSLEVELCHFNDVVTDELNR